MPANLRKILYIAQAVLGLAVTGLIVVLAVRDGSMTPQEAVSAAGGLFASAVGGLAAANTNPTDAPGAQVPPGTGGGPPSVPTSPPATPGTALYTPPADLAAGWPGLAGADATRPPYSTALGLPPSEVIAPGTQDVFGRPAGTYWPIPPAGQTTTAPSPPDAATTQAPAGHAARCGSCGAFRSAAGCKRCGAA